MSYFKVQGHVVTTEFYDYFMEKIREIYPKESSNVKAVILEYKRWDDSEQPGIDERITIQISDGKKYHAAMTHNRWSNFKEVTE